MTRRGLTLLEVLLASVLLTLVAAACVPVLTEARELMERGEPSIDAVELSTLTDVWLETPEALSRENLDGLTAPGQRVRLGEHEVLVAAHPSKQPSDGERLLWLSFTVDGVTTFRWVAVPAAEEVPP